MPSLLDMAKQSMGSILSESLQTNTNPYLRQLHEDDKVIDGDTISGNRLLGFDTFESSAGTDKNEKARKLLDVGISTEQQKELGLAGKQALTDWTKENTGAILQRKGFDKFGRPLLDSPQLAEHMVASGTAVPTDRYDEKLQSLYRNARSKVEKLEPKVAEAMDIQREYNIDRQNPGLLGSFKKIPSALMSAGQQLVAGVGDFALDVVTPGDNKWLNEAKSAEAADKNWGYDARESKFRTNEAVAEFNRGNYGTALKHGAMVTPELLAESAPVVGSYFIPVVGEAKMAAWLGKSAQYLEKAKGAKDAVDFNYKLANFARGNMGGFALNVGAQTNTDIDEFTKNNSGVAPDAGRVALMTANNTLQMGTDKFIDMSILKGKDLGKFVDTMRSATKVLPDNAVGAVAGKVAKTALALGEEGGQEYYQQWAQILNQKLGTTKYGSLENLMNNEEVLNEALGAGIMGAAMGGGMSVAGTPVQMLNADNRTAMVNAIKGKQKVEEPVATEAPVTAKASVRNAERPQTPDEVLAQLDEIAVQAKTPEEIDALNTTRQQWTDIKNAVASEDVYNAMKQEVSKSEDLARKTYVNSILKKADSFLGKSKTLFDAVEGTPNENVYAAADSVVRGVGNEWDAQQAKPIDIADTIQAVQTLREMRNDYNIDVKDTSKEDAAYDKAVNEVKSVIARQLKEYANFNSMTADEKMGVIGDELYAWLKQSGAGEDINEYMTTMLIPVVEAIVEDKVYGSAPTEKPMMYKGIDVSGEITEQPSIDVKEQQTKTRKKIATKLYADTDINVVDVETATHTGMSKGSINKLAETFKVPAKKVQAALDIAFQRMQIKKMGDVSKESNKAQYEVYYGKDGILTNFMKYKTAAERGDEVTASKAVDNLVKRYVDQAYKYAIAKDSIKGVQEQIKALGKDVTIEQLKEAVGNVRITVQGATGSDPEYTIKGMDIAKLTDSVSESVREQIEMGAGGNIVEAIRESVSHIQDMFDREGMRDLLPERISVKKVLRDDIYNSLVGKIKALMDRRDELAKKDLDPSVERTGDELDRMAESAKELAKVELELDKRIKDQQKVLKNRGGNLYQYTNTTFRDSVDVAEKMGQEVGTITKKEADRLGLDLDEGQIKDYEPLKTLGQYKEILDKIESLKKERASTTAELNDVMKAQTEQRGVRKELLQKLRVLEQELDGASKIAVKTARTNADTVDKTVTKLTLELAKAKAREKELKTASAYLEKNKEVFENASVNAEKLVKMQAEYGSWMNAIVKKTGKVPSAKERNDKLREMVKGTELLSEIVNGLNKAAKIGVVLARKLMGVYTYDKDVTSDVNAELAKVVDDIEGLQEKLAKAKEEQKEAVRNSRVQIVQALRERGFTQVMDKKSIENALMNSTRLLALKNKVNKSKKMSESRLNEIASEIKELEGTLKGDRLYKTNIASNLNVVKSLQKSGVKVEAPLDMNNLKVRGSMLGNMTFEDLKTMMPTDKEALEYLDKVEVSASRGMKKLYHGTVGTEMLGKVMAQNPALMVLARVDKVEGKEAYEFSYDKDMLNTLMLATENYIAINGNDLALNTKLDVSKIIGVSEYDPKVGEVYHRMMNTGKLHTVIASRLGDDFARAIGISQGEMGTEQYRKLIADLGNTALVMAKENGLLTEPRMTASQWNLVAGNNSKMPEDSGVQVKFVKLKESPKTSVEARAHSTTVLKRMNETLDSLDEQSTYRTHRINAVKNGKGYEIDGSPFGIPEGSQEVMRYLEDQVYVVQEKALKKLVDAYRNEDTKALVMEKAGWIDLSTMDNALLDDKDAQESVNREIEDTMAKLDEMERAYSAGEIAPGVYFNWFFTSNGRYMIDSIGINPQADKHFSRFLIVPEQNYNREWNINEVDDELLMNDGIAQAFGHDIDKSLEDDTREFANGIIKRFNSDKEFESKVLSGEIKVPHFGHALQAIEFMRGMKKSGRFTGTLTAEYDAKTSGPMHKLMQAPILDDGTFGDITNEWLAKGAILVDGKFKESSAAHVSGIEDGYQTITKEADKQLGEQVPVKVVNDKVVTDYKKLFAGLNGLLDKLVDKKGVTKTGRTLGKSAFVPFGYAASTESIKRNIGDTLAYDILKKIVNPTFEQHDVVREALGMSKREYVQLQRDLRSKPANETYIKTPVGTISNKKDILSMLGEMFTMTYGEAYKRAMVSIFQPQVSMNEAIKDVTSVMFRMWKIKYDEMMAKEPNATVERKIEIIKGLEDYFPLIKAPWSKDKQDGIAIFDTKRTSMQTEELPPVNTSVDMDGQLSSETVQAMITEMEETFAAGAVLPIHWIDGTQIASVLMRGGITGVHDAIVTGMKGSDTKQTIKDMNQAMYDVNKSYNMFDEFQLALLNMLDKVDDKTLDMFVRQELAKEDAGINLVSVKDRVDNIAENIRKAREKLYGNEVTVGNIIAFKDTEYKGSGVENVNVNESAIKELLKKLDAKMEALAEKTNKEESTAVAEEGIAKLSAEKKRASNPQAEKLREASAMNARVGGSEEEQAALRKQAMTSTLESKEKKKYSSMTKEQIAELEKAYEENIVATQGKAKLSDDIIEATICK